MFFFCFFLEFNVDNKVLTIAFLLVSPPLAVGRRHVPRSVASSGSGRMRQCAQLSAGWGSACLLWLFVFNQGYSVAYLCFCCQMTAWIFVKFDEVVDVLRNSLSCAHREEACRGEVECRFILPGCKINKYFFKVNKEPKLDECRFPPGSQLGWRGRDNRNWDFFLIILLQTLMHQSISGKEWICRSSGSSGRQPCQSAKSWLSQTWSLTG